MDTSFQVLVLLVCVLHAHPALSSESVLCVASIDLNHGVVMYADAIHNTSSQDIPQFVDELSAETAMALFTITAPSYGINAKESRSYQVSKTDLCYYSSPELIDLMTFNALKLVARTHHISLDVHTFTTCGNESWESLLSEAFSLDMEDGFVKSLQASNQTYYSTAISSGLLVFMSLGLTSLFATFVVTHPIPSVGATLPNCSRRRAPSRVLAKMNSLNGVAFALYLGYAIFLTISYYTNLDGISALLANQYKISPFTSNAAFLFTTVSTSFLGGLFYRRNRPGSTRFTRFTTACSIALTTAALYHFAFFILVLVEDFTTAFSSMLIFATLVMCTYTSLPTAFQYYRVAKSTKQYCTLWFLLVLSNVAPFLYVVTITGAKELFNAGYVYIATESWLAVVLFTTTLTWFSSFFMLTSAFIQKGGVSREQHTKYFAPFESVSR